MSLSPVARLRSPRRTENTLTVGLLLALTGLSVVATAETPQAPPTAECCRHEDRLDEGGLLWTGSDPTMTIERLAAYAAPVLWVSPDEPLLKAGPEPFPFEEDPAAHATEVLLEAGDLVLGLPCGDPVPGSLELRQYRLRRRVRGRELVGTL